MAATFGGYDFLPPLTLVFDFAALPEIPQSWPQFSSNPTQTLGPFVEKPQLLDLQVSPSGTIFFKIV